MAEEEIKKEQQLLVRATVNYLFLAQFETFRASLLRLKQKYPALAAAILQTVIEKGARLEGVAWSSRTSSPAHLTWLSIAELLNFETSTSADPQALQLKAEFLLLIESIKSRIIPQTLRDQPQGPSNDRNGEPAEAPEPEKATSSEGDGSLLFFESLSSYGLQRLQAEIFKSTNNLPESLTESEVESLRRIARDHPELMAALCDNIQRQVIFQRNCASKLAISLYDHDKALKEAEDDRLQSSGDRPPGESSSVFEKARDDFRLGLRIEEEAQLAHLDVLKESLERHDLESAIQRLRFLRQDNGLPSPMYWSIIHDLIKVLKTPDDDIGSQWFHLQMQEEMLKIYEEVLTSNSKQLTKMVEDIQDDLINEEVEVKRVSNEYSFPPPLQKLDRLLKALGSGHITLSINLSTAEDLVVKSCKRELYHFARVSGEHVLEVVLKAALFAVKNEHLQEASNILALYPRLQPLVAAMGWDLLSGKTIARRKMMELLWTTKSTQLRLEDLSIYGRQGEEICCVEYLCDHLCFRLELAYFAACNNSGQNWDPKTCLLFSGKKGKRISEDINGGPLDPFVANFVLERLAVQTPLRVLFDVVPDIKFKDALELVNMQPVPSATAAWHRLQDVELLHMHYGLQSAVLALGVMEISMSDDGIETNDQVALWFLKELQDHLEAIGSPPRKLWMMNIIISLLHMDDISINTNQFKLSYLHARISSASAREELALPSPNKSENQSVVAVIGFILKLLYHSLPSAGFELELKPSWSAVVGAGKQAWEWRASTVKQFVEDWEWRLSVLKRLLPSPERQWNWKEALAILRAAPSTLLNLCMQRAQYDIGEEAVHRFALPPEDKVALQLAEWVDSAFTRASVEDAVSRVAEGMLSSEGGLDFATFRSHLGTLATVLLCIDVAVTSARSTNMATQLLDQARSLLSEISTGGSQREGLIHWEQIQELCIISVVKRVLQRSQELLDQYKTGSLQAILSGETVVPASYESNRQGNRHRALLSLQQIIEDAHRGKRQFLSGKLHNLVKAITDEESDESNSKVGNTYAERKAVLPPEQEIFLGLGFRPARQVPSSAPTSDQSGESLQFGIKSAGKRLIGHLSSRQSAYLAAFIRYIATIGDIVDGIDTTHDFNFFSLVYEWPNDLLTRLVFERGSADAAGKVADVMGADLVHEVISACVPLVFPPRSKNGWACIPRAAYSQQNVENGFHGNPSSASMHSRSHASVFGKSKDVKAQFYPLRLNVVRHLATISPVRAVLACVFGSSIFSAGYEYCDTVGMKKSSSDSSDADRIFYEFSLDQSYRFPTLNRWIQMQANLHRLSDSPITSRRVTETNLQNKEDKRITVKRLRESEGNESEEDEDVILGMPSTKSVFDIESKDDPTSSAIPLDVMNSRNLKPDSINSLLFDWDNEVPYEEAVESLIEEGKLLDALALSDRCLRDGASDRLLQLLIERGEEGHLQSGQLYGYGTHQNFWSNSWQYCIRLRDKRLAANLALKYLHRWELDKSMDVLTMCSCHLDEKDPLRREVVHRKQALQRCNHILCVDERFGSWQEVEAECKVDPEGLALRLAGKGAVSAALEVAESAGLSIELRRELQGRQLVKLLTADPIGGGGPAEASRFLCSLHEPEDALPVAMGAMQQLPNLQSKQLLVHFFLKRGMGTLSDTEAARLNRWALGLRVLGALPLPWQQRCSALHEHPHLILETLLMWKQLQSAKQLLNEFPSLRDELLILTYAAKAITVSAYPSSERRLSMANVASKPSPRTSASNRSNFSNSLNNLQKEARRAFSWTSRDSGNKIAPKEMNRKRKSSGLPPSQRVAWEAMAGIQEDRTPVFSVDGQERLASVAMAEGWVLTGDPVKDEGVRLSHRYESAPDIILLKALLSLCSDQSVAAKGALELCITQMKHVLSAQQIPLNASTEVVGRAYHATETFVQVLAHAKTELRKFVGKAESSTSMNKSRETDDGSSDTGSSSTGNQLTDELSELLSQADLWLSHAELLQSLLGSGVVASLDDVADKESAAQLRDRLIKDERYSMAVYTCKKCKIEAFPVWNAWGHALIRMEHYTQARVKFKQALQLHKGDPVPVIREIINTIEAGPPVDKTGVHSLYDHLAKSAPTILDDSLSADAYLNVLYMPSSFPRSERLRRSSEDSADPYKPFSTQEMAEDGPRSNLDNVRYMECVSYLQEYARAEILEFMFRHGHYKDACLLFFPPNAVPTPLQPSLPQRQDSIATDYGTIDDLCELCISHGAMPVLEHVIAMRSIGSSAQETVVNQHTANALTRICNYCETHRNFNHLYRFQVLRKDHVAAGLCCIQLFLNSPHQEQALKHLEHAKMHFEDGLTARHKLKSIPKPGRGKSASEKLTEEELVKFSARVAIQMDVVRCFSDAEFPPWKHSLFGNPNDSETFRRRCEIAETLVERNFDLAFQIIYEFNLPAVHIYAGVAASLAERKKGNQLTEFLKNIKGTIEEDDWDQVLGAAINVFANRHRERPDKLIDMLSSSHRKVLACVVCGRLKSAFQIASRSGNVADVQYVAHQALKSGALPVLDMCKQWLAQYM
ncbi:uncharacterized protein LOC131048568 isoform X2 [Cryptomeria japonica]|uniref:uncharacterized protein LOC131048568 isoform X2 n=1 Tax=Cryptomeria japonica TaxID=3369 RepID=UPI0025ACCF96|nr:uncharacterized protein LOC131048568 isoform X2 [Cryptomeria japonica]